jgi:hypothetical protein
MLANSQKHFYGLNIKKTGENLGVDEEVNLDRREIFEAIDEPPIKKFCSSYLPQDHVIRDMYIKDTSPVVTFPQILRYHQLPLAELLITILDITKNGLGSEAEIEFSINLPQKVNDPLDFKLLQVRPMIAYERFLDVEITEDDIKNALCVSTKCFGRNEVSELYDILLVDHDIISSKNTLDAGKEVSRLNAKLMKEGRKYLLVGPGRWGSCDHCLGIPVGWQDICATAGIVESRSANLKADPSQGTHFFQNITSLGLSYFTVSTEQDFLNLDWVKDLEVIEKLDYVTHYKCQVSLDVKIDPRKGFGIITKDLPVN